ncbi:heavy-metal-associated domain-containing protein [Phaeovulum sp.]|uniref:heavy-metal-associated domain-containing protein n=1 Tax=Phaeovulum sp. TaxID=2934796 RepID=UPI00356655EC
MILSVPDMSCGHCKATIEAALAAVGARVEVDLPAREITVSGLPAATVLAALKGAGYPAEVVG